MIHVVAAALVDTDQQILVSRRAVDAHQGGLWEFPGGKLELGESPVTGLQRELQEELGVVPLQARPLIQVEHHYDDRSVLLDVYRVDSWEGNPSGLEGQPVQWVSTAQLRDLPMPAADVPVVSALCLPDSYQISPTNVPDAQTFLAQLEQALRRGLRLFQYRVFDLPGQQKYSLAAQCQELCDEFGAQMLINADQELARKIPRAGLHLNRRQLMSDAEYRGSEGLLAASCHDQLELRQAERRGLDFAVLSPVTATPSHPDANPIGWQQFGDWVRGAAIPVYALGGMKLDFRGDAWKAGAQGVAGIRGLWLEEIV
ncbi:MAG: Nudix family hydrolase [bacterium]